MRRVLQDTMTDPDGTTLVNHVGDQGNRWTLQFDSEGGGVTAQIAANRYWMFHAVGHEARYSASLKGVGPEMVGEMILRTVSDLSTDPALMVRANADASDGYVMQYERAFDSGMNLQRYVAGVNASLGTWAFVNGVGVDVRLTLRVTDGLKEILVDGVSRITSTDNTVATGNGFGITAYNALDSASTGQHVDSITGWEPEIQHTASNTTTNTSITTTITLTKPTGVIDKTLLLAVISVVNNASAEPSGVPAGWALALARVNNSTNALATWVYYKYVPVAANESATTYQWTGLPNVRNIGHIMAYPGVSQDSPIITTGVTTTTSAGTAIAAPSVSPGGVESARLVTVYATKGAGGIAPPSPQAERGDSTTTAIALAVADEVLWDTAATGTRTATGASGVNNGISILLRPIPDTPELYGRPAGLRGGNQMRQLLAQ